MTRGSPATFSTPERSSAFRMRTCLVTSTSTSFETDSSNTKALSPLASCALEALRRHRALFSSSVNQVIIVRACRRAFCEPELDQSAQFNALSGTPSAICFRLAAVLKSGADRITHSLAGRVPRLVSRNCRSSRAALHSIAVWLRVHVIDRIAHQ